MDGHTLDRTYNAVGLPRTIAQSSKHQLIRKQTNLQHPKTNRCFSRSDYRPEIEIDKKHLMMICWSFGHVHDSVRLVSHTETDKCAHSIRRGFSAFYRMHTHIQMMIVTRIMIVRHRLVFAAAEVAATAATTAAETTAGNATNDEASLCERNPEND